MAFNLKLDKSLLLVILGLVAVQALCFGPMLGHVGFYLDDWVALCLLHFAPKDGGYFGVLHHYMVTDTRVIIRPLEALHFVSVYCLSGDKPLLWHAVNFAFEIFTAIVFYLVLLRLTARRAAAFFGAAVLLLYPSHDATHYWVVCSSVALSLFLYMVSLWASLKATDSWLVANKKGSWCFAAMAFLFYELSILNYEVFLPLAALNVMASMAIVYTGQANLKKTLLPAFYAALPLILAVVALLIFRSKVVPVLGQGYVHGLKLDAAVMCSVVGTGLALNNPLTALQFFSSQVKIALVELKTAEIVRLLILAVLSAGGTIYLLADDKKTIMDKSFDNRSVEDKSSEDKTSEDKSSADNSGARKTILPEALKAGQLVLLGLATIFFSYTIFGLSRDYTPTYATIFNRINTGAAVGITLVLSALFLLAQQMAEKQNSRSWGGILAVCTALFAIFYTLTDWGLAKPWVASWTTQKQVRQSVSAVKDKLDKDDSLLLVNCPRYVMWSPVFDGVWDFQSMTRMTLDRPDFKANVVSDRLTIGPGAIKDVSYGYVCGTYPFDKLYLMVAPQPDLIAAHTAAEFINVVASRGMTFGLDKKVISKWQGELAQMASHAIK